MTSLFISLEGPDGAGKSSQIDALVEFLKAQGYEVVVTREPGGTPIGDEIRDVLHDVRHTEMVPAAEVLLYSASRAQLVEEVIRPALDAGKIVVCDRFADSTIAYQGYGRGLDLESLQTLTEIATGGLKPDLTLLLDIDGSTGLARRREHGEEMNRLDLESAGFYDRVRAGYHERVREEPDRWIVIDAGRPPEMVRVDIQQAILEKLREETQPLEGA